ncbi:MAG TPA: DcaP family trimeric outer membrane transporter [Stellaceae bacterium]|nr:DcaP family trimeric outer membrane transporter [Stellaceae bacterium]
MVKARKIGVIAALGSSTAALAMLTGLSGARADELQVNQQLLDQRIDQLAAGQYAGTSVPFTVDVNPAAGAPVTGGSFPRSILIPGTDTSLKIYGQITLITDYWLSGGPTNSSPYSSTIGPTGNLESVPLEGTAARARSNGIFQMVPRESKIGFETRTPTPFGEARTLMEWDWNGGGSYVPGGSVNHVSDSLVPRIRYAYGTLGGLLAGQATSNFSDPDANPNTIDFGGEAGTPGVVRLPQIRYTMPVWYGASLSVSAESPETDLMTSGGLVSNDTGGTSPSAISGALAPSTFSLNPAKSTAPDLTAAWYLPQAWGHIDISGVIRPGLEVDDGKYFARDYVGFGGHFGMDFKPGWFGWVKDDFVAQYTVGQGLGRYLNASLSSALATNYGATGKYGNTAGPTTAASAAAINIHPITEEGALIGYNHWWLPNLQSDISGGFDVFDIQPSIVGPSTSVNKELITAHVNLIWSPVSFVDIGLEYTWGQRTALNNGHETQNALISEFKFRF